MRKPQWLLNSDRMRKWVGMGRRKHVSRLCCMEVVKTVFVSISGMDEYKVPGQDCLSANASQRQKSSV